MAELAAPRQGATLLAAVRHLETASVDDALDVLEVLGTAAVMARSRKHYKAADIAAHAELTGGSWKRPTFAGPGLEPGRIDKAAFLMCVIEHLHRALKRRDVLAHYGRIFKTLHLLQFLHDEPYRRMIGAQLNVSETRHQLARKSGGYERCPGPGRSPSPGVSQSRTHTVLPLIVRADSSTKAWGTSSSPMVRASIASSFPRSSRSSRSVSMTDRSWRARWSPRA